MIENSTVLVGALASVTPQAGNVLILQFADAGPMKIRSRAEIRLPVLPTDPPVTQKKNAAAWEALVSSKGYAAGDVVAINGSTIYDPTANALVVVAKKFTRVSRAPQAVSSQPVVATQPAAAAAPAVTAAPPAAMLTPNAPAVAPSPMQAMINAGALPAGQIVPPNPEDDDIPF